MNHHTSHLQNNSSWFLGSKFTLISVWPGVSKPSSVRSQTITISGFMSHLVSLCCSYSPCCFGARWSTDSMEMRARGWVSIHFYLQQAAGWIWPVGLFVNPWSKSPNSVECKKNWASAFKVETSLVSKCCEDQVMCLGFMLLLFVFLSNSHGKEMGWRVFGGWAVPSGCALNSGPSLQPLGLPGVSDQKRQNNNVDV